MFCPQWVTVRFSRGPALFGVQSGPIWARAPLGPLFNIYSGVPQYSPIGETHLVYTHKKETASLTLRPPVFGDITVCPNGVFETKRNGFRQMMKHTALYVIPSLLNCLFMLDIIPEVAAVSVNPTGMYIS